MGRFRDAMRRVGARKQTALVGGIDVSDGSWERAVDLVLGSGTSLRHYGPSYERLFRSMPPVFAPVRKLSSDVSRIPIKSYTGEGVSKVRIRASEHPLPKLLAQPWPGGSTKQLVSIIVREYSKHGRCPVAKLRPKPSAAPDQLIPMRREHTERVYDSTGRTIALRWTNPSDGKSHLLGRSDILDFEFPGSGGVSPIEPIRVALDVHDSAQRTLRAYYRNGARTQGVITTDRRLDPEAVERLERMVEERHGGVDNSFRIAILANMPGAKWHGMNEADSTKQSIEHTKLAQVMSCAVFDIQPPMIADLDRATFSNIDTQKLMHVDGTIAGHCANIEDLLICQLIEGESAFEDCTVEFDLGEAMRGNLQGRADAYTKLIQVGFSINQILGLENLPRNEDPWADCSWVPANLVPIGAPGKLGKGLDPHTVKALAQVLAGAVETDSDQ